MSRAGDQAKRLGQLILGGLTASRDELKDILEGDPEAVEAVRERGAQVVDDVGGRVRRIAGAGAKPRKVLNAGHRVVHTGIVVDDDQGKEPRR